MTLRSFSLLLCLGLGVACSGSATNTSKGGDGDGASGGQPGSGDGDSAGDGDGDIEPGDGDGDLGGQTGGRSNSGGSGSGAAASGGASSGGGIGEGGASDGDGGSETGGTGTGGNENPGHVPVPSSGCDAPNASPWDTSSDQHTRISFSTPEGYDGSTPRPLVIGLNGNGSTQAPMETVSANDSSPSDLARDFLIARLHRESGYYAWETQDIEVYDIAYEVVESTLCFDTSRIFGVGNAGGGRYLNRWIMTDSPDNGVVRPHDFHAIAIVGAVYFTTTTWPQMPTVFVHSIYDASADWLTRDSDGTSTLTRLQGLMSCTDASAPAGSSTLDGAVTTCTDFTDCNASLRFCSYDQNTSSLDEWHSLYTTEIHRFFSNYL